MGSFDLLGFSWIWCVFPDIVIVAYMSSLDLSLLSVISFDFHIYIYRERER